MLLATIANCDNPSVTLVFTTLWEPYAKLVVNHIGPLQKLSKDDTQTVKNSESEPSTIENYVEPSLIV